MMAWSGVAPYFSTQAVAHVATLNKDGGPHVVPVWVDLQGETDLVFFSIEGSLKDRNLSRDPRVAFSITGVDNPFAMATVKGEVVERVGGEAGMEIVDRISRVYTGQEYEQRGGLVAFVIRPRSWWSHDYSGE